MLDITKLSFKEIEKRLYEQEDALLDNDAHMQLRGLDPKDILEDARTIASNWVRYTKLSGQNGISPNYKLAVKHVVALINGRPNKAELSYGRTKDKDDIVGVPIYDPSQEKVLGFNDEFGEKVVPYKLSADTLSQPKLEVISSCRVCPTQGKCDLVERCSAYNSEDYQQARRKFETYTPTTADYLAFEKYARTVKHAKEQ